VFYCGGKLLILSYDRFLPITCPYLSLLPILIYPFYLLLSVLTIEKLGKGVHS
jgi:hypothetical protein